jgi:hypothetical protein
LAAAGLMLAARAPAAQAAIIPAESTADPAVAASAAAASAKAPAATQRPAATNAPPTATEPPAPDMMYDFISGPPGYYTDIWCNRDGADCAPVMPPGDISFDMFLASSYDAPWTLFVPYGLSVEHDGVNIADWYMFVDEGWLSPGGMVRFGASRRFTEPGRYVIRSAGCYSDGTAECSWAYFPGTSITFVIQP